MDSESVQSPRRDSFEDDAPNGINGQETSHASPDPDIHKIDNDKQDSVQEADDGDVEMADVKQEGDVNGYMDGDDQDAEKDVPMEDAHTNHEVKPTRPPPPASKKSEPKRPGKESGRFWKCYWDNCDNVYTRRRTVTDHMIKVHKITKDQFDTEKCREIIYLDEAKTRWEYLDPSARKRMPKKGTARPTQALNKSQMNSSTPKPYVPSYLLAHSPTPESLAKRKTSAAGSPAKSTNASRAATPVNKERPATASPAHTDNESTSGEDDYDEEDGEVYCLCRKPDDGTPMVCCDGCDEWYHTKCVKLHPEEVNNLLVKFFCPPCTEQAKGISVFRIECSVTWCRKAATPETKHRFCGPQHHEDWILYHLKRSDPQFQLKSRDSQNLYNGWVHRMKQKHGDEWEPQQLVRTGRDKTGKTTYELSEEPTLGGSLKGGELKALIQSVESLDDFKALGNGAYIPVKPSPNLNVKVRPYQTDDTYGRPSSEQEFIAMKELLDLRRQVLTNAKAKHKPRVFCGYDDRLSHHFGAFKKIMEAGDSAYKPCEQKNCRQHADWVKNETRTIGLETEILRDQAKEAGIMLV